MKSRFVRETASYLSFVSLLTDGNALELFETINES
jgi:hypothetical protein